MLEVWLHLSDPPYTSNSSSSTTAHFSPLRPLGVIDHCFPGLERLTLHPHLCRLLCDQPAVSLPCRFLASHSRKPCGTRAVPVSVACTCSPQRLLAASELSFTMVLKQNTPLKSNPLTSKGPGRGWMGNGPLAVFFSLHLLQGDSFLQENWLMYLDACSFPSSPIHQA